VKIIKRLDSLIHQGGLRAVVAHSLKYAAYRVETIGTGNRKSIERPSGQAFQAGTINEIGAVVARTLADDQNPAISLKTPGGPLRTDRVAVIAHAFYTDIVQDILDRWGNLPSGSSLFISTDSETKRDEIITRLESMPPGVISEFDVRIAPNRGRDVAPKLLCFDDVYARFDIFLHLHSKKSPHAETQYGDWRRYLLDHLIGSPEVVSRNLEILSDPDVGIVYPDHAPYIKPIINWGYDFPIARSLLHRIGFELDAGHILEFPSGSMFWGRTQALSKLRGLGLSVQDFPEESGQIDGTLAHAIERSLLYFVEAAGFEWRRTTLEASDSRGDYKFVPLSSSNSDFPRLISWMAAETTPFSVIRRNEEGVRFNLLVPTIDPKQIYGGITTAIAVFNQIRKANPEAHFRVLVTDSGVDAKEVASLFEGFDFQTLGSETQSGNSVVDCCNRIRRPLELISGDIFIATAWWTALNAYRLQDEQQKLFKSSNKIVYLIQDYEPGFYGWSTKYQLAKATYYLGDRTLAIFNSEELANFMNQRFHFPHSMVLPYTPNPKIDRSLSHEKREPIILFYSRISAARNCFDLGIDGLALWRRRNPDKAHWRICCIGEAFDPPLAASLINYEITGKMSLDEYASLLSRASVGLSLMISPHPSYPPLEMAFAGMETISNKYENKDLTYRSERITSLESLSVDSVADAVEQAVSRVESCSFELPEIRQPMSTPPTVSDIFSPDAVAAIVDRRCSSLHVAE
jgi:O-antigen biosynthesis protein